MRFLVCLFLLSVGYQIYSTSSSVNRLKIKILRLTKEKKLAKTLPLLKQYTKLRPHDIEFQLLLAENILMRKIPIYSNKQDPYCSQQKKYIYQIQADDSYACVKRKQNDLQSYYRQSARLFNQNISLKEKLIIPSRQYISQIKPQQLAKRHKEIARLYFLAAFSEIHAGFPAKAIQNFQKSAHYPPIAKKCYYNIASLLELMNKPDEAKKYWHLYQQ